jgi:hypothetical protein
MLLQSDHAAPPAPATAPSTPTRSVRPSESGALLDALDALHVLGERFEFEDWRQVFRPQLCQTSAQRSWERFKAALRRFGVPFGSEGRSSPVLVFAPGVRGVIESLLPSTDNDDDDDAACEPRAAAGGGQFDRPHQRADLQRVKAAAKRLRFTRREARRIESERARASVGRQLLGRRLLAEQAQRERRAQAPAAAPSARRAERSTLEKILAAHARRVGADDVALRAAHASAAALERSARACFAVTTARDAVEFAHELARRDPSLWVGRASTARVWWGALTRPQRAGA